MVVQKKRSDIKQHQFTEDGIETKQCCNCKEWKKIEEYGVNNTISDGLNSRCRPCDALLRRERKDKPKKERIKTEHVGINGIICKKCNVCKETKSLESFYKNKQLSDGLSRMCITCEKANRDRDHQSEYNKGYKQVPENKARRQEKKKQRKENDPEYKLEENIRSRQRHAIIKGKKLAPNKELWGESITFIRSHIQDQFHSDMTWDNYGELWELDHILPCAAFDMNDLEEQKICFNWQNLQPLIRKDNNRKKDKIYRDLFDMNSWMLTPAIIERMTPNIIEENFYHIT